MTQEYQETRKTLYKRIRTLRKEARITQEEMARQLGISRRTYANYERGIHAMPVEVLVSIADMFDTTLDYLAGREISAEQELTESGEAYDRTGSDRDYHGEDLQNCPS